MTINDRKTAREYVAAWQGHSGAPIFLRLAAESQEGLAVSYGPNDTRGRKHAEAARILRRASSKEVTK